MTRLGEGTSSYHRNRDPDLIAAESNGPVVRVRLLRSLYFGGRLLEAGSEAKMYRWEADVAASLGRVFILSSTCEPGKA